jgi:hypothetical protein
VGELQGELPSEILELSLECYQGARAGKRRGFELRMRRQDPIPPVRFAALIGNCAIRYESVAANNNPLLADESQDVG